MTAQTPMTVIGGFLGAGKTTLLNRLLTENHGVRYAILVNDFGDLVIDADLVQRHGGDTITFANGCVCCTLGDNFMVTLEQLLGSANPPEQILIEASGVADPRSLADIAVLHPRLKRDLILILADASSVMQRAKDELLSDTVVRQLNAADMLVLNKCDLLDNDEKKLVVQWLHQQTPAPVIEASFADIPVTLLAELTIQPQPKQHNHSHNHAQLFTSVTLLMDNPVNIDTLRNNLALLPRGVLRVKGFLQSTDADAAYYLIQRSGPHIDISKWPENNFANAPGLMFIGTRDMPGVEELKIMLFG